VSRSIKGMAADLMGKLVSKTTQKLVTEVDDKKEGWLDRLIETGKKQIGPVTKKKPTDKEEAPSSEDDTDFMDTMKVAAHQALQTVADNKQPFLRLGTYSLGIVVAHWASDEPEDARRRYLATQATFAERRQAMHAAGDAVANDKREREESWDAVVSVLKSIGSVGLRILMKALVAGIAA